MRQKNFQSVREKGRSLALLTSWPRLLALVDVPLLWCVQIDGSPSGLLGLFLGMLVSVMGGERSPSQVADSSAKGVFSTVNTGPQLHK